MRLGYLARREASTVEATALKMKAATVRSARVMRSPTKKVRVEMCFSRTARPRSRRS